MTSVSNFPTEENTDSSTRTKVFFNNYFNDTISYPAEQIDAVVGFFRKRGFDDLSSNSTAIILLQQAKLDNVNVFKLIDTLQGLNDLQLSAVVAEVLNYNREKTSTLGYRVPEPTDLTDARNILL
jgi:hypothetical protein